MLKLLIVDDEKIIRETMARLIDWDSLGIQLIGTAKDGIEAYNTILDEYPDIVLTDIKMPGLSGLDLIQRIHDVNKDTQFIILSGYGEFEYAKIAMQYGIKHYLLKPCNEMQLVESLMDVIKDYTDYLTNKNDIDQRSIGRHISQNLMVGIINDFLSLETPEADKDISRIVCNYKQYIDFDDTPYKLFYVYYVVPDNHKEILKQLNHFRDIHCPGITFNMVYVHNTLVFFYKSLNKTPDDIFQFLKTLELEQDVTIEHSCKSHANLRKLLKELMRHLKRYEVIYFTEDTVTFSIYNYQNIIKEVQRLISSVYSEDKDRSRHACEVLLGTFDSISDADFLKQLAASITIFSVSNSRSFDMISAAELLVRLGQENNCCKIVSLLKAQLLASYNEYHSLKHNGDISEKIEDYVEEHIQNCELSLKWIAENHLFMNVDYLSKRFLKETGCKFSKYLTDTRVKKAKEILAFTEINSIQWVAEMVGCGNNPQYFSQIFKKSTGMTPSSYMKMIHGEKG